MLRDAGSHTVNLPANGHHSPKQVADPAQQRYAILNYTQTSRDNIGKVKD